LKWGWIAGFLRLGGIESFGMQPGGFNDDAVSKKWGGVLREAASKDPVP
jgi:hypothetical protein